MKKTNQCFVIIFSVSGYGNPISFKKITDEDISVVEASIREKTLGILTQNLSDSIPGECDVLVDDEQLIDYFGPIFAQNTCSFVFQPGDILLIKDLVDHVKRIADDGGTNEGLHHFAQNIEQQKSKRGRQKIHSQKFPILKHNKTVAQIDQSRLKSELLKKISALVKSYTMNQSAESADLTADSTVKIDIVNGNKIFGLVFCPICKTENKHGKPKRVYYNFKRNGHGCWVLSNFDGHLKKMHELKTDDSKCEVDKAIGCEDDMEHVNVEEIEVDIGHVDDVIVVNEHELVELKNNMALHDVLYGQFSHQITNTMAAVLKNNDTHEQIEFIVGKSPRKLTVANINGDGNCLFSSLAHQLWMDKIDSAQHRKNAKKLRAATVKHILDPKNFPMYEFQLRDRVYEIKSKDDIADMTAECKLYVSLCLAKNKTWGGAETLKAVCDMYNCNIIVFNEDSKCTIFNRAGRNHNRTIAVAYRLGWDGQTRNHYDSVCDLDTANLYAACNSIYPNVSKT